MNCDLYQNPYQTHCSGSMSPDGEVSVCWRHLQASRDWWMKKANELALKVARASENQHSDKEREGD